MADGLKNIAIQAEELLDKVSKSISKYKTGITNLGLSKNSAKSNKLEDVIKDLDSNTVAHATAPDTPVTNDMMRYTMEFYDQKNPNGPISIGTNNSFRLGIDFRVFNYNFLQNLESAIWVLAENDAKNGYIYCVSNGKLYRITIFKDRAPDVMEIVMGKYTLKGRIIKWADNDHLSSTLYLGLITTENKLIVFDTTTGNIEELAAQPSAEYISYLAQPYPIISTVLSDTAMHHIFIYNDSDDKLKLGRTTETFRNIITEDYDAVNMGLYSINNIDYFSALHSDDSTTLYSYTRTVLSTIDTYMNSNKSLYWIDNIAYGIDGTSLFSSSDKSFTLLGGLKITNNKFNLFTMVNDQIIIVDNTGIYLSGDTNHLVNNPVIAHYEITGSNIDISTNLGCIVVDTGAKPAYIDKYFMSTLYMVNMDDPQEYIIFYNPLDYDNMGLDVNCYISTKKNDEYQLSTYKINNYDYDISFDNYKENFNILNQSQAIIPIKGVSAYADIFNDSSKRYSLWCTYTKYDLAQIYSDIKKIQINTNLPSTSDGNTEFTLDVTSGNYYEWYRQSQGENGQGGSIDDLDGEIIRVLYDDLHNKYYAVGYQNDDEGHRNPLLAIYDAESNSGWKDISWAAYSETESFYEAFKCEGEYYDVLWNTNGTLTCVGIYYVGDGMIHSMSVNYGIDDDEYVRVSYKTDVIRDVVAYTKDVYISSIDHISKIYQSASNLVDCDYNIIAGYVTGGSTSTTEVYTPYIWLFTNDYNTPYKKFENLLSSNSNSGYISEVISITGNKTVGNYSETDNLTSQTNLTFIAILYEYQESPIMGWWPSIITYDNEFNGSKYSLLDYIPDDYKGKIKLEIKNIALYVDTNLIPAFNFSVSGTAFTETGYRGFSLSNILSGVDASIFTLDKSDTSTGHHSTIKSDLAYDATNHNLRPIPTDNIDKVAFSGNTDLPYITNYEINVDDDNMLTMIELNTSFGQGFYLPPVLVYEGYNYNDYTIPTDVNDKDRYFVRIYNNYEATESNIMTITLK